MATVTAPVADFNGEVVGVSFHKGRGTTTDPKALAYFRRHGYGIGGARPAADPEPPDPRHIGDNGDGIEVLGTRLRDAAVDPRPGDYLPPTNAGEANPHGPLVVSPEIHGSQGVRPVRPGAVEVTNPAVQEVAETTHAAESVGAPVEAPAKNASKAAWVAYAVSVGGDQDEVGQLSRDELAERYSPVDA